MSVRVLIIDDQNDFRRLLARHIHTGFESPSVAEYEPAVRGRLPPDFSGSAYDAVLLGDMPGSEFGIDWLRDLSRRNGFPPIIYFVAKPAPDIEEAAIHAGAHACLSRRLDRTADPAAIAVPVEGRLIEDGSADANQLHCDGVEGRSQSVVSSNRQ